MRVTGHLLVVLAFMLAVMLGAPRAQGAAEKDSGKDRDGLTTSTIDAQFGAGMQATKAELNDRIVAVQKRSSSVIKAFWSKKATPTINSAEAAMFGTVPGTPVMLGVSGGPQWTETTDDSNLGWRFTLTMGIGMTDEGRFVGVGWTQAKAPAGAERAKIPLLTGTTLYGGTYFGCGGFRLDGMGFSQGKLVRVKSHYAGTGNLWGIGAALRASVGVPLTAIKSPTLGLAQSAEHHAREAYVHVQCGRFDAARRAVKKAEGRMRWADRLAGRREK